MRGDRAEIGYASPSGRTAFYNFCGERVTGDGYRVKIHPAPWLEDDNDLGLPPRSNFGCILPPVIRAPRVEYSRSYTFATLTEFKAHLENLF